MKYTVRAIKYFFYFSALTAVFVIILSLLGLVEGGVEGIFREGWDSLWKIAILFGVFSAIYPKFGFGSKEAEVGGSLEENSQDLKDFMHQRRYIVETTGPEKITFRRKNALEQLSRVWEDRVTVTSSMAGVGFEGMRKDIVGLALGFENYINRKG